METCRKCIYCYKLKRRVNDNWEYSSVCILFPMNENNGYDDWALELDNNIDSGLIYECFTKR